MILDMRTIIFIGTLTNTVCLLVILLMWQQSRQRFAGITFWVVDFAFQATAFLLIALRGIVPDWASVVLSNTLVFTGSLLGYMGLLRFTQKKDSHIYNYVLLAALVGTHSYFTFVQPSLAMRNLNVSLGLLVICFQCLWLMLYRVGPQMRPLTRGVGIVFGIYCLLSIIRIGYVLAGANVETDFMQSGTFDALILAAYHLLFILLTYSLVLMFNQRLLMDIGEQEDKFSRAFYSSPYAITITRASDGQIMEVNKGFENITGYALPELKGKKTTDLHLWAQEENRALVVSELLQNSTVRNKELLFRKKSGEMLTGLFSADTVTINNETCVISSINDITARKRAEEEHARLSAEVRAQARQMAQILATVPAGVLLLDAAGRILQANTEAVGDLAALAGVAVGDTLTHLGDRTLAELLTSPPVKGVWHEVKADGRTFEVIAQPVENGSDSEMWVLVIIDVTRERKIQAQFQQQAQLAAVGQLAAGIAHDFNNIMAVIVLYTQMGLRMADVPPKLRERLEVILQQVSRATDLIQQILDFSRRAVLERRPLDLLPFLKETVKLLERTLPESIRINLVYGKDEYTVGADPTRMQQAIMNLATNARDAMLPQGRGELHIVVSRTAATDAIRCMTCGQVTGKEWVCIAVTDSGSGIAPEVLSHIFEPFFTTKEVGKGTGLGLSQVYGIVKQHEGHIDVVTAAGRGTTFSLYLPALPVQPSEAPDPEREAPIKGQGETVLLVEDNTILRDALADTLKMLNYQTLQAANGREALAVLEQHADAIALVLSDLVMPEMGGQALFHAMRQRGLTLPVVILSGHPLESELEVLQAQGLAGWLLKPTSMRQLGQLLARALHKES